MSDTDVPSAAMTSLRLVSGGVGIARPVRTFRPTRGPVAVAPRCRTLVMASGCVKRKHMKLVNMIAGLVCSCTRDRDIMNRLRDLGMTVIRFSAFCRAKITLLGTVMP